MADTLHARVYTDATTLEPYCSPHAAVRLHDGSVSDRALAVGDIVTCDVLVSSAPGDRETRSYRVTRLVTGSSGHGRAQLQRVEREQP
jgi:hypothetical protein